MQHGKNTRKPGRWDHDCAMVADSFPLILQMLQNSRLQLLSNIKLLILPSNKQAIHPLLPKMRLLAVSVLWGTIRSRKIPEEIAKIIARRTTRSKYKAILLKKWKQHALSRNEDPIDTSEESVLSLLHSMCNKGCYIMGSLELGVSYLVFYALRDFLSFQTIQ